MKLCGEQHDVLEPVEKNPKRVANNAQFMPPNENLS